MATTASPARWPHDAARTAWGAIALSSRSIMKSCRPRFRARPGPRLALAIAFQHAAAPQHRVGRRPPPQHIELMAKDENFGLQRSCRRGTVNCFWPIACVLRESGAARLEIHVPRTNGAAASAWSASRGRAPHRNARARRSGAVEKPRRECAIMS
jgi:hypothetical protein